MTVTFLTLNKSHADIDSLVIPVEAPDVKSKLRLKWSFWVQTDAAEKEESNYNDATKQLIAFDTIESFWATFSNVPQPSVVFGGDKVYMGDDSVTAMMLFRDGVRPEWEDPVNAEGGHFQFHWKPNGTPPAQLDEYWNNLVLAIVGDTIESEGEFSPYPIIQGVRFVDKLSAQGKQAGVRIEVWFSKPVDPRHLQRVRSRMEKAMALHTDGSMGTVPRCDVRYHCNRH
jgi:translation initiation factor 4E